MEDAAKSAEGETPPEPAESSSELTTRTEIDNFCRIVKHGFTIVGSEDNTLVDIVNQIKEKFVTLSRKDQKSALQSISAEILNSEERTRTMGYITTQLIDFIKESEWPEVGFKDKQYAHMVLGYKNLKELADLHVFSAKRKLTKGNRVTAVWRCDDNWEKSLQLSGICPPTYTETFLQNLISFAKKANQRNLSFQDCLPHFQAEVAARRARCYTKKDNFLHAGDIDETRKSLFSIKVSFNK